MSNADAWSDFFARVKSRPASFYERCAELLSQQDLYEPADLADVDFAAFKRHLESSGATAGQQVFLEQAADLAKAEALARAQAEQKQRALETPASASNAAAPTARRTSLAQQPEVSDWSQSKTVATIVLPGDEPCEEILRRGGLELNWRTKLGAARKVTKYRPVAVRQIVDNDLCLPTLYLHFLDARFFLSEKEYDPALRSGNDNAELQLALPEAPFMAPDFAATLGPELGPSLCTVVGFLRSQAEVVVGQVDKRAGGFSPKASYRAEVNPQKLYFSLRTARPKSSISLDKRLFGIPEEASIYLFAENHISVNAMSAEDIEAFERCIAELPEHGGDLGFFATFLKIFFEGGFAYNKKVPVGNGYIPQNVGLACMHVVPAFAGQLGIATGNPYIVEPSFLKFSDTVPVTIRGINRLSERHARYGLCFTRSVFVWESPALEAEGVLNFSAIAPHGGFFYLPGTLQKYRELGGLIYAFGEDRSALELPVELGAVAGNDVAASSSATPAPAQRAPAGPTNRVACVICLSEEAVMVTVPCGHRAFCEGCARRSETRNRPCPVCRASVQTMVRVY
eukprot:TRINITY_DN15083_c2_g1_i1.p1 TRINITY_DN15083_c2_g1~~TRINITY_DN15083_c2_g1_i1.p1  ORF type:complete len:585 (-),score=127.99 TRINITY_DN15083_c2_g1_i1:324-2030(-)